VWLSHIGEIHPHVPPQRQASLYYESLRPLLALLVLFFSRYDIIDGIINWILCAAVMAKYSKNKPVAEKTQEQALKIARATQKPGQTKEQTKLISQGIQKGIEQYKKLYKAKSRELDKKLNKATANKPLPVQPAEADPGPAHLKCSRLPWILLISSWLVFALYLYRQW